MKSGTVLIYLFFDCMNFRAGLKGYLPCQVKPLNVSSRGALGLCNIMLMKYLGKDLHRFGKGESKHFGLQQMRYFQVACGV